MLSEEEFNDLSSRLEQLSCADPKAGDGLFTFVMLGEPEEKRDAYENHIASCEFCRTAVQVYRYKRDAAKLFNKWETARTIISAAEQPGSGILKRQLGNNKAYFQPSGQEGRGITVLVGPFGEFLSVEEQSLGEFRQKGTTEGDGEKRDILS